MRDCAAFHDAKPEFLYVYVSARGVGRGDLVARGQRLLLAGLAWYKKSSGLAIMDRDGESFEFLLSRDCLPTDANQVDGTFFFGNLRVDDIQGTLVP